MLMLAPEMVLSHNVTLSTNDTRVLVWISSDNVKAVAEKGYKVIHAASDYFYLVRQRPVPGLIVSPVPD